MLADCIDLPYAPRNILRKKIAEAKVCNPAVELAFTFGVEKMKPDESAVPVRVQDGGLMVSGPTMGLAAEIDSRLRGNGIPLKQYL